MKNAWIHAALVLFSLTFCAESKSAEIAEKADPETLKIIYKRAGAFFQEGRIEEAKREYLHLLSLKPDLAQAHHVLGMIYFQQDNMVNAKEHFEMALEKSPNDANLRYLYASALNRLGKFDLAIKEYLKALEINPTSMKTNHDLGTVYYRSGNMPKSIEYLKKALEISPDSPVTMMVLGMAYIREKKTEHTIEMILELRRVKDEVKADGLEKLLRASAPQSEGEDEALRPKAPPGKSAPKGGKTSVTGKAQMSVQTSVAGQPPAPQPPKQQKKKSKNPFQR